jgi:membrane associated rhomboid family serine protease
MKDFLRTADEVPVTMVVGLAYATLALLTDPFDPSAEQLDAFGWLTPLQTVDQPWRLLAHAFLHGGFVHLAFNTWLLVAIGPPLERAIGSLRMALLYVLSALGGGPPSACSTTSSSRSSAVPAPCSACSARSSRSTCTAAGTCSPSSTSRGRGGCSR